MLVERFWQTSESSKESLKVKRKLGKILTQLSEITLFTEEMQALILPNLSLETFGSFKDEELHETLITLIGNIFIPRPQNSKASNQLIMSSLLSISEAISAFIVHPDTRISQRSTTAFETLIKQVVAMEPTVITHLGDKL